MPLLGGVLEDQGQDLARGCSATGRLTWLAGFGGGGAEHSLHFEGICIFFCSGDRIRRVGERWYLEVDGTLRLMEDKYLERSIFDTWLYVRRNRVICEGRGPLYDDRPHNFEVLWRIWFCGLKIKKGLRWRYGVEKIRDRDSLSLVR